MKKTFIIHDTEHTVEIHTIKATFPFYAKKESWTGMYLGKEKTLYSTAYYKFYDEFRYTEIDIAVAGEILLEFTPSGRWVEEGYTLSYDDSYGRIIKQALDNENDLQVSTEEEFNNALELYKTKFSSSFLK